MQQIKLECFSIKIRVFSVSLSHDQVKLLPNFIDELKQSGKRANPLYMVRHHVTEVRKYKNTGTFLNRTCQGKNFKK